MLYLLNLEDLETDFIAHKNELPEITSELVFKIGNAAVLEILEIDEVPDEFTNTQRAKIFQKANASYTSIQKGTPVEISLPFNGKLTILPYTYSEEQLAGLDTFLESLG